MARALRAALCGAAILSSAAAGHAADWRVFGTVSQSVSGSAPFGTGSDSASAAAATSLGVTALVRTPRTQLTLSPSVGVSAATRRTNANAIRFTPSFRSAITHQAPRLTLSGALSVVPQFRSQRTFDLVTLFDPDTGELGVVPVEGTVDPLQVTLAASGSLTYALGPRDSVTLGANAQAVEYVGDSGGLSATRSLGATLGWNRQLTTRATGGVSTSVRRFDSDSATQPSRTTYSVTPSLSYSLTPRHSIGGGLGLTYIDGARNQLGFNGNARLSYRSGDTGVTLGLVQALQQNDDGAVNTVTRVTLSASRRFTPRWAGSVATSLSNSSPVDGSGGRDRQTFTVGPSVSYAITPNWSVRGSYGLVVERVGGDLRGSNRASVQLSRSFDF